MRFQDSECPNCKGVVAAGWRFCQTCGCAVPLVTQPEPPTGNAPSDGVGKFGTDSVICWQCGQMLDKFALSCPVCGADPGNSRQLGRVADQSGFRGRRILSLPMNWVIGLLVASIVISLVMPLIGANQTGARDNGWFPWSAPSINLAELQTDDVGTGKVLGPPPAAVPATAERAELVAVNEDGTVVLLVRGETATIRLAGVAAIDILGCLGFEAVTELRRMLSEGTTLFLVVDGQPTDSLSADVAWMAVYIWAHNTDGDGYILVNEALIASGVVAMANVRLVDSEPGQTVRMASERARSEQRSRYAPNACQ